MKHHTFIFGLLGCLGVAMAHAADGAHRSYGKAYRKTIEVTVK
jgi:hypothetical protein